MSEGRMPDEITVELATSAKFALAAGQSDNPGMTNDELVAEALEARWDVDGQSAEENSHLTSQEQAKVEELQDNLNMFG